MPWVFFCSYSFSTGKTRGIELASIMEENMQKRIPTYFLKKQTEHLHVLQNIFWPSTKMKSQLGNSDCSLMKNRCERDLQRLPSACTGKNNNVQCL